jgi:hypothetical protein
MQPDELLNDYTALPAEAQRLVADYVAWLKRRYNASGTGKATKKPSLRDEPFIGMWKDRADLQDSAAWVRELRKREWAEKRG